MTTLPDWLRQYKTKGIAIDQRNGRYYAYRVSSVWNPEKHRSQKITEEYLGVVTPEGILPPKHKRPSRIGGVLDAGNFVYLEQFTRHLTGPLSEYFPEDWQSILAAAVIKLCYREPLGRMRVRYETSLSKRFWPEASLNKNSLTQLLVRLGFQWPAQRDFFTRMASGEKHMAIDLSHIFSESQNIPWIEYGHNGDDVWRPQLGILLVWCTSTRRPGFLKLLPGAAHSAQCLANTVWEAGLQGVIAVVDKGFWSPDNMLCMEEADVNYAMALKRDLPMVKHAPQSSYKKYFRYRDSIQWWHSTEWDGRVIHHYLDKSIANEEESAYLKQVEKGVITIGQYKNLKSRFGTLSILTDAGLSAEETYALYKERRDIEYAFDTLKTTLGADTTWMQSRESFQGYLFIHFVALHIYSQVLDHLKRKDLLKRYSVLDMLTYLSKVCVVEIDGKDRICEVTRQTKKVIDLLEVPITQKLGS